MKNAIYHLELITPCFCAGADQGRAEIRPASIRGELRWWFRVLGGTPEQEKAVFGGVHGGVTASALVVRVTDVQGQTACKNLDDLGWNGPGHNIGYLLWPLRPTRRSDQKRGLLEPAGDADGFPRFRLTLTFRRFRDARELDSRVLETFTLLGSIGTRARRGFGGLWPVEGEIDGAQMRSPADVQELSAKLKTLLNGTSIRVLALTSGEATWKEALDSCGDFLRRFRVGSGRFGAAPSRWGRADHDLPIRGGDTAYRPVIGLPLAQRYRARGAARVFETSLDGGGDRWASPVRFKIVRVQEGFLPLAVFVPDLAIPEGARITVYEKRGAVRRKAAVSHDLFRAMMDPGRHREIGWNGAKVLV